MEDMIFRSFHQGKGLQHVFELCSIYSQNLAACKQVDKHIKFNAEKSKNNKIKIRKPKCYEYRSRKLLNFLHLQPI